MKSFSNYLMELDEKSASPELLKFVTSLVGKRIGSIFISNVADNGSLVKFIFEAKFVKMCIDVTFLQGTIKHIFINGILVNLDEFYRTVSLLNETYSVLSMVSGVPLNLLSLKYS